MTAYQALPLSRTQGGAAGSDGARTWLWWVAMAAAMQIWERSGAWPSKPKQRTDAEDGHRRGKHWREDKIGLLQTMTSAVSIERSVPGPFLETFVDPTRILKLARELKKQSVPSEGGRERSAGTGDQASKRWRKMRWRIRTAARWSGETLRRPRVCVGRTSARILATRGVAVGLLCRARARRSSATARTTTGRSGAAIFRRSCRSWISSTRCPMCLRRPWRAGPSRRAGPIYEQWIRWVWSGEVAQVIAALAQRQLELGMPSEEDGDTSPTSGRGPGVDVSAKPPEPDEV